MEAACEVAWVNLFRDGFIAGAVQMSNARVLERACTGGVALPPSKYVTQDAVMDLGWKTEQAAVLLVLCVPSRFC